MAGSPADAGPTQNVQRFRIEIDVDVIGARFAVRRLGETLGFVAPACTELAIVVSELGTNILKYAKHGEILLARANHVTRGAGVRIEAIDWGPPFHDLTLALRDGHGDRGPVLPERLLGRKGIGSGLGAVVRFTDSFECHQLATEKRIVVVRYRKHAHLPTRTGGV